jgi:hypothetical protein
MIDPGRDQHGPLGEEAQHAQVDAVRRRAVGGEPALAELLDPEGAMQRQRVAAGALLALRRDDMNLTQAVEGASQRGQTLGVGPVIIGDQ